MIECAERPGKVAVKASAPTPEQPDLFAWLVEQRAAPPAPTRKRIGWKMVAAQAAAGSQMELVWTEARARPAPEAPKPKLEYSLFDEVDDEPVQHRLVSAAAAPPVLTTAPRSIWDLAASPEIAERADLQEEPSYHRGRAIVEREEGVTRHTGSQYPNNRWTEEKAEQERQRRARQKPPRPPKQTFRIGSK